MVDMADRFSICHSDFLMIPRTFADMADMADF